MCSCYVVYFYNEICFLEEKNSLVVRFLCSASVSTFPQATCYSQEMATSCCTCVKYHKLNDHTSGCTWSISSHVHVIVTMTSSKCEHRDTGWNKMRTISSEAQCLLVLGKSIKTVVKVTVHYLIH